MGIGVGIYSKPVASATVVYSIIFLREAQSILENLCDAGADLKWLLIWNRKKQEQIFESEDINLKKEDQNVNAGL